MAPKRDGVEVSGLNSVEARGGKLMCHPPPAGGGCAKRSRAWAVQARSPDKVLHYFETTGGHAETAGGCGGWAG
ncbi:MAG: hypothetical protein LBD24_07905 [Spirochaetaceae bacterium]|nr:hypothetical protein [Spirochaetaceae bacterium]